MKKHKDMTNYNDFQLDEHQIDAVKKMHQKLAIMGYIKEHGSEPSDISEYYTATEDELELYKRAFYAKYAQNQPKQQNNEIWYTSTDGNRVELYGYYEGVQPISNTYSYGKGVMVFEDDLTSIGNDAFHDCESLTSITIPSSVTSIGKHAFAYCSSLSGITIPSSVTSIGEWAFEGCESLTDITIPSSVMSIGLEAFWGTGWYYNQGDGLLYLSNCLVGHKGDRPSGDVTIEDGTRLIANHVFEECYDLTGVTISESVTSIGERAFYSCENLTSITIPSSVTNIGNEAFYQCSSLTGITIPSSVTSIGQSAFYQCSSLTGITIPSSVTSIGNGVFCECYNLSDITIPSSVTSIGSNAFGACHNLTDITIPSSVTSIGNMVFVFCENLTGITIPSSVTIIGSGAFDDTGWYNSQEDGLLYLSNCLVGYKGDEPSGDVTIEDGTRLIADSAFAECSSLTSIEIPSSVTSIGEYVFQGCYGLTSVTIPSSVTSIGVKVFTDCKSLTNISVAEGNAVYDSRNNCNAIIETNTNTLIAGCMNTVIPEGVTSIGNNAFYDCDGLESITIPSSVTSIGERAFCECDYLESITFDGTMAQWNAITKGDEWYYYTPADHVQCTDGDVQLL